MDDAGAARILLVTPVAPQEESFGGSMRVGVIARTLAELGAMDLVLLTDLWSWDDLPGGTPGEVPMAAEFRRTAVLPRRTAAEAGRPSRSLVGSSVPGQIAARRRRLRAVRPDWLGSTRYDLVWYVRERGFLVAHPVVNAVRSIVDVDDIEDVVLRRWLDVGLDLDGGQLTWRRRRQLRADVRWWRATHRRIAPQVDVQVFSSDADRGRIGATATVVVPNTYVAPTETGRIQSEQPTMLFPGLLTYPPNEDAAAWIVERILPRIRRDRPDVRLLLVGAPSARVRALAAAPGVEVTGPVPSMAPYLRSADLLLAPLRVGGGTRIKILEAFAYGVPVVATSIGAEGLDVRDGVHLEIADDPTGLAERCLRLLDDPAARARLATAARQLHQSSYVPDRARARIREAVDLARVRPARSHADSA